MEYGHSTKEQGENVEKTHEILSLSVWLHLDFSIPRNSSSQIRHLFNLFRADVIFLIQNYIHIEWRQRSKRFFFSHNVNAECMLQVVLPTTVHNYTIDGLATSTFYDIQLLANNSDGTSLPSPTVTALTRYAFGESPQLQITFPHC